MALQASYFKKVFQFGFKARTSRGLMRDKTSWFIKLWDDDSPAVFGLGECGPLPGLSIDSREDFEETLKHVLSQVYRLDKSNPTYQHVSDIALQGFPAITFGLETAWLDLMNGGQRIIFKNDFLNGTALPINGLIWMGDLDFMLNQVNQKISEGFRCIKIKVGGLNFDRECDILHYIRKRYFRENIELRLDANGAFKIDDALFKLNELAKFTIHSIEQPIKAGLEEMEELCRKSPIPVALDEDLIGKHTQEQKRDLLNRFKPQFIILKPTLHGGLNGCAEWIEVAENSGTGWWITSALESNIGLNAISQFAANYDVAISQGLGTGMIYTNNFPSPLRLEKGNILYDSQLEWDVEELVKIEPS